MALRIKGLHDQNEYRRFYPGGETTSHILGFTGDHDVGQEGIELAQQAWLGGRPGSRRVIINRRGDASRTSRRSARRRPGRDLALAIDSRLQYLAFRELKAAVEAQQGEGRRPRDPRRADAARSSRSPTGRRTTPTPATRSRASKMRNRALTDVFEPGSTMKPFTIAAALERGHDSPGHGDPDRAAARSRSGPTRSTTRIRTAR